jgi:MOSC domain-containing protein YiiM
MKIVSINVALPREIEWKGMKFATGICKEPVGRRVTMRRLNLDGDRQADLAVHGGADKAVYVYPFEHYEFWRQEFPGRDLPWGMFGENLTTEGLLEDQIRIGDQLRIGSALAMVTQPRTPCFKLAAKFASDDMIAKFLFSGRSGFYLSVLAEGEAGPGDAIEIVQRDAAEVTVADINRLYVFQKQNRALLERALQLAALPAGWRRHFTQRLEEARSASVAE